MFYLYSESPTLQYALVDRRSLLVKTLASKGQLLAVGQKNFHDKIGKSGEKTIL